MSTHTTSSCSDVVHSYVDQWSCVYTDCTTVSADSGAVVRGRAATLWTMANAMPGHLLYEFLSPSPPNVRASPSVQPLLRLLHTLLKLSVTKQYTTGSRQLLRLLRVTVM